MYRRSYSILSPVKTSDCEKNMRRELLSHARKWGRRRAYGIPFVAAPHDVLVPVSSVTSLRGQQLPYRSVPGM